MINLTKEEKIVLVFFVACFLIGSGVNFYKKSLESLRTLRSNPEIALRLRSGRFEGWLACRTASSPRTCGAPRNDAEKVNINSASFGELMKLKGIGKNTASRIIDYRQTQGRFFFKEDLMKVKGIGKAKFDAVKDSIIVE